jgi:hypothetical protein
MHYPLKLKPALITVSFVLTKRQMITTLTSIKSLSSSEQTPYCAVLHSAASGKYQPYFSVILFLLFKFSFIGCLPAFRFFLSGQIHTRIKTRKRKVVSSVILFPLKHSSENSQEFRIK